MIDINTPIVLDFETYYASDYSLSKMTTEEYIRDPRFQSIGVSVKVGRGGTSYYKGETWLAMMPNLLETYPNSPVVSHNAMFDMGVFGLRYGIYPKYMLDTIAMSRVTGFARLAGGHSLAKSSKALQHLGYDIPDKGGYVANMKGVRLEDMRAEDETAYADYCMKDTKICYLLYTELVKHLPYEELEAMSMTIKAYNKPAFGLDLAVLQDYKLRLETNAQTILRRIVDRWGLIDEADAGKHLRSKDKFAELLKRAGLPNPPTKVSSTTGKEIWAFSKTDDEFMNLLECDNLDIIDLVEARLGESSSIAMTRCERFISIAQRGLLPIPLTYASAHTGRYGGCFVADTKILTLSIDGCMIEKNIVDVLLSDLVWDGEEWCEHSGVSFNGYQEVIEHDGLTGTKSHRVFIDENSTVTLSTAMRTGTPIMACRKPQDRGVQHNKMEVKKQKMGS